MPGLVQLQIRFFMFLSALDIRWLLTVRVTVSYSSLMKQCALSMIYTLPCALAIQHIHWASIHAASKSRIIQSYKACHFFSLDAQWAIRSRQKRTRLSRHFSIVLTISSQNFLLLFNSSTTFVYMHSNHIQHINAVYEVLWNPTCLRMSWWLLAQTKSIKVWDVVTNPSYGWAHYVVVESTQMQARTLRINASNADLVLHWSAKILSRTK